VLSQYHNIYEYALDRQADLLREAELARQARVFSGPRRPLRVWVADALYALANRIDSRRRANGETSASVSTGVRVTA